LLSRFPINLNPFNPFFPPALDVLALHLILFPSPFPLPLNLPTASPPLRSSPSHPISVFPPLVYNLHPSMHAARLHTPRRSSFQPNDAQHLSPARTVLFYFTYVWSGTDEDRRVRVRVRVRGKREERHGRTTRRLTRASSSSIPPEGWEGWGRSATVHGRGSEPPARRRPPRTRRPARAVLDPRTRAVEGGAPSVATHARGTTTSVAACEGVTSWIRAMPPLQNADHVGCPWCSPMGSWYTLYLLVACLSGYAALLVGILFC
jgi:hypothetical protein